jgi:hypothetical protein
MTGIIKNTPNPVLHLHKNIKRKTLELPQKLRHPSPNCLNSQKRQGIWNKSDYFRLFAVLGE